MLVVLGQFLHCWFVKLTGANLVPRHINCISLPRPTTNNIIICTCGKRKKLGVIIAMDGEVQNTRRKEERNSLNTQNVTKIWIKPWKEWIDRFHSCGQQLCKFIGTKESFYIRKEFNSHRIGLVHQNGRCFIVLVHQYGRRDVMWKTIYRSKSCHFSSLGLGQKNIYRPNEFRFATLFGWQIFMAGQVLIWLNVLWDPFIHQWSLVSNCARETPCTVEPRSTDTSLIWTPRYCGQFRLSQRGKAHTFSLKLTHLIRTLWHVPLVSILTGFHCSMVVWITERENFTTSC